MPHDRENGPGPAKGVRVAWRAWMMRRRNTRAAGPAIVVVTQAEAAVVTDTENQALGQDAFLSPWAA